MLANLDELVQKALKNIYGGFEGVEPHLYELTSTVLNEAVEKGLNLKYNVENAAFIHELKSNINVFAAFKAHNQCKDMVALLYDESGKIIPEAKWRKEALKISDHQNKTWLNTERNTALRRARIAAQFKQFDAKKDLYPNLRWLESTAGTPRITHTVFYDMVRPVTDPFWLSHFPGDEWNCKCGIEQTKDAVTDVPAELPEPTPGLDSNPYFEREIFSETHPTIARNKAEEKRKIKAELEEMLKKEGYNIKPDFKNKKGGKLFIHPLAHTDDLESNIIYSLNIMNYMNEPVFIREHSQVKNDKNPELLFRKTIGDIYSWKKSKNMKAFVNNAFYNKLNSDAQLAQYEEAFLALDFDEKADLKGLNDSIDLFARLINYHQKIKFLFFKNGEKMFIWERLDSGELNRTKLYFELKRELL